MPASEHCSHLALGAGAKDCPCTAACPRHGKCCECVAHHRVKAQLPACYFTPEQEKAYDRSIAFYLAGRKG